MFSPSAKRCFTFALFALLLTFPARGLDPLVELEQKREEEANRRDSNTPGPKAADELLTNQDWRNRMATQIALAIEACRYTGPLKELEAKAKALSAKDPNGAATVAAIRAVLAEQEKIDLADSARGRAGSLIGSLEICLLYTSPSPRDS